MFLFKLNTASLLHDFTTRSFRTALVFFVVFFLTSTSTPCYTVLCFIALRRDCICYKLRICDHPASSTVGTVLPTAFDHFMSPSHFGNSCNISKLFILVIFVTVICD